jgi:hypothetical protein
VYAKSAMEARVESILGVESGNIAQPCLLIIDCSSISPPFFSFFFLDFYIVVGGRQADFAKPSHLTDKIRPALEEIF